MALGVQWHVNGMCIPGKGHLLPSALDVKAGHPKRTANLCTLLEQGTANLRPQPRKQHPYLHLIVTQRLDRARDTKDTRRFDSGVAEPAATHPETEFLFERGRGVPEDSTLGCIEIAARAESQSEKQGNMRQFGRP
eukprot:2544070-Rhodomonas_salina.3